ncbi:MAG: hypothetical protein RL344_683 [Pseudomonadota bacterium]|jgi:hypothetical protein
MKYSSPSLYLIIYLASLTLVTVVSATPLHESLSNTNTNVNKNTIDQELRKEIHEAIKALWEKADVNKDNRITKLEAQAANMIICSKNFEAIDTNKDGKVSEPESKLWMKYYTEERTKHATDQLEEIKQDTHYISKKYRGMVFKSPEQRQIELLSKSKASKTEFQKNTMPSIQRSVNFSQ